MIADKITLTHQILLDHPETRGDGNGKFLNKLVECLFDGQPIDFERFNVSSYTRARRKVLELHSELDNRTIRTSRAVNTVISEVCNG